MQVALCDFASSECGAFGLIAGPIGQSAGQCRGHRGKSFTYDRALTLYTTCGDIKPNVEADLD